ncbi:hypothetical protein ADIWIN_3467 [Winogradskyella psychrotolerans RS-3]|uniref:Uncharacterized protein n=1 Tax=Winogradskyella psychrotolerans RS-3 TaxID=641526 RepID=S7VKY7_9FLAO|nr:hypothetical protein ADIWIN_3467 [Winogradskyella psychrotolerans RS-3]
MTSILSIIGLAVLLVFSPCKVRNSIQDIVETPKTEVSNKSISSLKSSVCDISTDAELGISKSNHSLQLSQAVLVKLPQFNGNTASLSDRPVTQYYNARADIPPLAPYYILFKNNKAYL